MFFQEALPAPVSNTSEEKVKQIMLMQSGYTKYNFVTVKIEWNLFLWIALQKVLSRQEELKERARLLLEQARRDAAMKAGNKSTTNAQSPTHTPPIDVSSHTRTHFCLDVNIDSYYSIQMIWCSKKFYWQCFTI